MEKENSVMPMEEPMMENGKRVLWMALEDSIIPIKQWHMKENGRIMHFVEKEKCSMKIHRHLNLPLIIKILIIWENIGNFMKANLTMMQKKVMEHCNL